MAKTKRSFGCGLILASRPDLKFDAEQIPKHVSERGSIDDVAVELERIGSGSAHVIRTNALALLGARVKRDGVEATKTLRWLISKDRDIGVWSGCACVREALRSVHKETRYPLRWLAAIEGWLAGTVDPSVLNEMHTQSREMFLRGFATVETSAYFTIESARSVLAAATATTPTGLDEISLSAANAANVAAYVSPNEHTWKTRDAEMRRLVSVIADALPGMPVRAR